MTALSNRLRFWADAVVECNRRDHTNALSQGNQRGPFRSARVLGMAMAALHDGYALAVVPAKTPLLPSSIGRPVPPGADAHVVAAAACKEVLTRRYPLLIGYIDSAWRSWLDVNGLTDFASSPSEKIGQALGKSIEEIGVMDPTYAMANQYMPTARPYTHNRPTNEPNQNFSGASWGKATRLLAAHVTGFPPPPGRVDKETVNHTQHFRDDLQRVAEKGGLDQASIAPAARRTLDEETTGIFWGYDGPQELGTPPRLYMQVVLAILDNVDIAAPAGLPEYDGLHMVSAIAVAMADAGIDAWHYKYSEDHMMWRPCLGIPSAVPGNGTAVPLWQPLGRPDTNGTGVGLTPDFPAYPSGHATFGAAAFQLLRLMLKQKGFASFAPNGLDDVRFDVTSDEYDGRNADARTRLPRDALVRGYPSLWKAITDNSVSRVYLGVHWQFDGLTIKVGAGDGFGIPTDPTALGKTGGVWLGCRIANQIAEKVGVSAANIAASKAG